MKLRTVMPAVIVGLALAGCTTPGRHYDDTTIARITRGTTTEAELVDWFGPPASRSMAPDGSKMMSWSFAHGQDAKSGAGGKLQVQLDKSGTVTSYTASNRTR